MFGAVAEELVAATDAELDEFIRAKELERRSVEAQLSAAIAVANARALPEADGHRSMKAYLKATLDWSDGECARFRGAARTIDEHAEIGDAWLDGRLGAAQVSELSRVRSHRGCSERFGEFVPLFVEQGEQLPLREFKVVLQRFTTLADADDHRAEREAVEARTATAVEVGGELFLRASGGDSLATAEFLEILERFAQAEFVKDQESRRAATEAGVDPEPYRSGPQRRFDALITMALTAAAHEGEVVGASPLVSVLVDQGTMSEILARAGLGATESLNGEQVDPFTGLPAEPSALGDLLGEPGDLLGRRCETTTGQPLRVTDVLRAMLSGEIRRVVLGAKRRVVDMGRSSRVFTGAAADAARLLAITCEHPGCDMPAAWCHIDHSTEWWEHGRTDQDNAAIECPAHNNDKHRSRRTTRRDVDGRLHTFRPDGTIILPVGQRPPRFEPDEPAARDEPDRHGSEPQTSRRAPGNNARTCRRRLDELAGIELTDRDRQHLADVARRCRRLADLSRVRRS